MKIEKYKYSGIIYLLPMIEILFTQTKGARNLNLMTGIGGKEIKTDTTTVHFAFIFWGIRFRIYYK